MWSGLSISFHYTIQSYSRWWGWKWWEIMLRQKKVAEMENVTLSFFRLIRYIWCHGRHLSILHNVYPWETESKKARNYCNNNKSLVLSMQWMTAVSGLEQGVKTENMKIHHKEKRNAKSYKSSFKICHLTASNVWILDNQFRKHLLVVCSQSVVCVRLHFRVNVIFTRSGRAFAHRQ